METPTRSGTTRRRHRFLGGAGLAATVLTLGGCFVPGPTSNLSRSADPVVMTGADAPSLVGTAPGEIVAFRHTADDGWDQVPVQVDERAVVNFGTAYHQAANSVNVLTYADPGTWAGADPDPKLDADDEIAFMAHDAGGRPDAWSEPAGVAAGTGVEVRAVDLTNNTVGVVYLFRSAGGLDPGAGRSYVSYEFSLDSGDYKTTYRFNDGPNPEDSTVTTPYYSHHFGDRWQSDELRITAPGASGVDILDRHKNLFAPSTCGRSEDTFNDAEGAFIVNRSGPVRAIRSYIGANSGPNTQREHIFYEQREEIRTYLRVHQIPSVMDFFDYSPAAVGMTYRNDLNPAGVTIDGVPDTLTPGTPAWELVDGPQGSMVATTQLDVSYSPATTTGYYLDDAAPTTTQCTGDAFAYGSSGSWVTNPIPCTDPAQGCTDTLTTTRMLSFGSPGRTAADAALTRAHDTTPLRVLVEPWSPPAG
jgi:hypothetical protein